MEVWLRTNRRAILFGLALPVVTALIGLLLLFGLRQSPAPWMQGAGVAILLFSLAMVVALLWQLRQPRMAYSQGHLLLWLRSGPPIKVPIEAIECFWLGQAPSLLPGKSRENVETSAIVIRVADKAKDWHHQDVKPQLGKWCEGYITLRGTWCEPLHIDLVNKLNQRLAEVTKHPAT